MGSLLGCRRNPKKCSKWTNSRRSPTVATSTERRYWPAKRLALQSRCPSPSLRTPRRKVGSANRTSPTRLMRTSTAARPASCCPITTPTFQRRLDSNPDAMRTRRETVEHPFGTIRARMGATHFLMKRLRNVAAEMALHVLAYNLTRAMNIVGKPRLIAAICAA
ncbi:transposase [Bradyrhizobium sp. WSM1417]|uniref:transposase n=1 Tax=Bradyrhizobium sp. WSM1417 TaxID=754500 RepID=UPI003529B324